MSTILQKYSLRNQAHAIASYAAEAGLTIVRTYKDEGKSGLQIAGREGLTELIGDVRHGRANFNFILVYDVSRWGRFQDVDESAHYEFLCKDAGIQVLYCAEEFKNDGSMIAGIVKNLKRAMAGEYSRDLSAKVFAGQCHLGSLGFRQGGTPGYGLRRILVDENGSPKATLAFGERKSLASDRVILQPGPQNEVQTVQRIFYEFAIQRKPRTRIAKDLNGEGIANEFGRPWTSNSIWHLLNSEKYIGNNVYNRTSYRLGRRKSVIPREKWIRSDHAFEAVVDPLLFGAARDLLNKRRMGFSKEEMLTCLSDLLVERGRLSGPVIASSDKMPCVELYRIKFGSLSNAYKLVGYEPAHDMSYVEIKRTLRSVRACVINDIFFRSEVSGELIETDKSTNILTINNKLTVSIFVARAWHTPKIGLLRWYVEFSTKPRADLTIAVRMDETNKHILDYYFLPGSHMPSRKLILAEKNAPYLDVYRSDTLDPLFRNQARYVVQ